MMNRVAFWQKTIVLIVPLHLHSLCGLPRPSIPFDCNLATHDWEAGHASAESEMESFFDQFGRNPTLAPSHSGLLSHYPQTFSAPINRISFAPGVFHNTMPLVSYPPPDTLTELHQHDLQFQQFAIHNGAVGEETLSERQLMLKHLEQILMEDPISPLSQPALLDNPCGENPNDYSTVPLRPGPSTSEEATNHATSLEALGYNAAFSRNEPVESALRFMGENAPSISFKRNDRTVENLGIEKTDQVTNKVTSEEFVPYSLRASTAQEFECTTPIIFDNDELATLQASLQVHEKTHDSPDWFQTYDEGPTSNMEDRGSLQNKMPRTTSGLKQALLFEFPAAPIEKYVEMIRTESKLDKMWHKKIIQKTYYLLSEVEEFQPKFQSTAQTCNLKPISGSPAVLAHAYVIDEKGNGISKEFVRIMERDGTILGEKEASKALGKFFRSLWWLNKNLLQFLGFKMKERNAREEHERMFSWVMMNILYPPGSLPLVGCVEHSQTTKKLRHGQIQAQIANFMSKTKFISKGVKGNKLEVSRQDAEAAKLAIQILGAYYRSQNEEKWSKIFASERVFLYVFTKVFSNLKSNNIHKIRQRSPLLQSMKKSSLLPWE